MAQVKGFITLIGTIDGINFYMRKGVPTARSAGGGFTAHSIKTKASMDCVRRNNSEFGGVSKVNKLIKNSLSSVLFRHKDGTLHARLMGVLLKIKVWDLISLWGERRVWNGLKHLEGKKLFLGFAFMPTLAMSSVFNGIPSVSLLGSSCSFAGVPVIKPTFKSVATHLKVDYFVVDYSCTALTYGRYDAGAWVSPLNDLPGILPDFEVLDLPSTFDFRMAYLLVEFCHVVDGKMEVLNGNGMAGLWCLGIYDLGIRS